MNTLLHREGGDELDQMAGRKDREVTLGTSIILVIFLALAILCAIFFGFGYSVGRKSSPVASSAFADGSNANTLLGPKPAAGSAIGGQTNKASAIGNVPLSSDETVADDAGHSNKAFPQAETTTGDNTANPVAPSRSVTSVLPSAPPEVLPAVVAGGGSVVQIAAVSHQEDADLLATTLKRRGYEVVVHSETQDKLLHVQIGPFASHKDADTMRQRLLSDGFNAIVKDAK